MNYLKEIQKPSAVILVTKGETDPKFIVYKSPYSQLSRYVFGNINELKEQEHILYGYQVGTVAANLANIIPIKKVYAKELSEPGKSILDELKVPYEFEKIIDLVKSSKNLNKVCPLETSLIGLNNTEAIRSLREKYNDK